MKYKYYSVVLSIYSALTRIGVTMITISIDISTCLETTDLMVHATWGDWFIRNEIESPNLDRCSIWYLGGNGFILRSPATTLYIDPFFGDGDPPRTVRMIPVPLDPVDATLCDGVLVTHEHTDHMHPPSYGSLLENGGQLHAPNAAFQHPASNGDLVVSDEQRHVIKPGDEFDVGDFTVHVREANDPDAIEPVSYVIENDIGTFFHGGDSRPDSEFTAVGKEFDIDLGVLAFGTAGKIYLPEEGQAETKEWYMNENQIVEAANDLQLTRLVPSHYDMWKGVSADPKVLSEHSASFPFPKVIEPVKIGDRLELSEPGIKPSKANPDGSL